LPYELASDPDNRIPTGFDCTGLRVTRRLRVGELKALVSSRTDRKQNVTISLGRQVLKKATILAARRETSISGLLAQEIEALVGEEEAYERAEKQTMALLQNGFHLGGAAPVERDELRERKNHRRYECLDLRPRRRRHSQTRSGKNIRIGFTQNDGMKSPCVVNLHNAVTVSRNRLVRRRALLSSWRMGEILRDSAPLSRV